MNALQLTGIVADGVALAICLCVVMMMPAIDEASEQRAMARAEKISAAQEQLRQRIADKWPASPGQLR